MLRTWAVSLGAALGSEAGEGRGATSRGDAGTAAASPADARGCGNELHRP
jgi:hypothetical protein